MEHPLLEGEHFSAKRNSVNIKLPVFSQNLPQIKRNLAFKKNLTSFLIVGM